LKKNSEHLVIAAIGVARFVKAPMVKPGAVVVDGGVNRVADPSAKGGSRLVGDVDFDAVSAKASAITPVPGGVGAVTNMMLARNTLRAARLQLEKKWMSSGNGGA
jgi:methylenetetrahydrofolate dehydrogenase (NADP+)/methenyltetrahydrofolate cyclohydrolase